MQLNVNDKTLEVPEGTTVSGLLAELALKHDKVAVAVDGDIVPRSQWAQTCLRSGQVIEIIQVMSGG